MSDTVIEMHDVYVELGGVPVVEGISLQVERGTTVAIIGPNGAGKTTLLRAALGLIPITSGSIRLWGVPVSQLGALRQKVGYVPQRLEFDRYLPLTVREMLQAYVPYASRAQVEQALHEVGLGAFGERLLGKISGGQLQRAVIALNLLRQPELLFLDEPATGVDVEGEARFYEVIERLRQHHHLTVVLVSHDLSVVTRYASQVLCINRRLFCFGPPTQALTPETIRMVYGQEVTLYAHREHSS